MEEEIKQQKEKSSKMVKLLENELFQELILNDFIKSGSIKQVLDENLDNSRTIDELKARQILHKFIFNAIITADN